MIARAEIRTDEAARMRGAKSASSALRRRPLLAFAIACSALSACATQPPQPLQPGESTGSDWKLGHVRKVVLGSQIKDVEVRPCVARLPVDVLAARYFVVVTYPRGRARGYRTVDMPATFVPEPGQPVWVNVHDCSAPLRDATQTAAEPAAEFRDHQAQ